MNKKNNCSTKNESKQPKFSNSHENFSNEHCTKSLYLETKQARCGNLITSKDFINAFLIYCNCQETCVL